MTDTHQHHDAIAPYVVQLLLDAPATVDPAKFLTDLQRFEPSAKAVKGDPFSFELMEPNRPETQGFVSFSVQPGLAHPDEVRAAASQTWDWPVAPSVAGATKATVVVSLESAPNLDRGIKLRRVHDMLRAAMEQVKPLALHFLPSQRLVDPAHWKESVAHGAPAGDNVLNVRLFKVPDGLPGEGVMDTMGLAAFGLPDLECHFHGLDLGGVAQLLFAYAEYTFDKGDVLHDDTLVRGLASHEEWECVRRRATSEPDRDVVAILPDPKNRPK